MKTVYIVFTVVEGYAYIICHNDKQGFYVKTNPSDDEVCQWPDEVSAQKIADRNTTTAHTYKVKPVEVTA